MKLIEYKNNKYPYFQSIGNSAQFIIPFAKYFCEGVGYDIGCGKKEWALPNAIPIDEKFNDSYTALNLPKQNVDFIFSSHCLEHIDDWVSVMDYWYDTLREGGILFLYLPHYDQVYWRVWNNRKHKHNFTSAIILDYMKNKGYKNIFIGEKDLNYSFAIVGEK
jgi:predicted SAM-dependent methyltransferase